MSAARNDLRTGDNRCDLDGSGSISVEEFVKSDIVMAHGVLSTAAAMFQSIDTDASGEISLVELMSVAFPQASRSQVADMIEWSNHGTHLVRLRTFGLSLATGAVIQDLVKVCCVVLSASFSLNGDRSI